MVISINGIRVVILFSVPLDLILYCKLYKCAHHYYLHDGIGVCILVKFVCVCVCVFDRACVHLPVYACALVFVEVSIVYKYKHVFHVYSLF